MSDLYPASPDGTPAVEPDIQPDPVISDGAGAPPEAPAEPVEAPVGDQPSSPGVDAPPEPSQAPPEPLIPEPVPWSHAEDEEPTQDQIDAGQVIPKMAAIQAAANAEPDPVPGHATQYANNGQLYCECGNEVPCPDAAQ